MQNLLDLKKLGMQQGGHGKHFKTQTRRSCLILVQQVARWSYKFWKHSIDQLALNSILQHHLPLLAALTRNF